MTDFILHLRPSFTDEEKENSIPTIEKVVKFAELARRQGLLAFEAECEHEESVFVKYILMSAADGIDKYSIKASMQLMILADNFEGTQLLDQLLYAKGFLCILDGYNSRVIKDLLYAMLGEKFLRKHLEETSKPSLKTASEILNGMKDKKAQPECIEFEKKLLRLNRVCLQRILREIHEGDLIRNDLTVALHGCGFEFIYDHILDNVSQNTYKRILEDMENIKSICSLRDILDAQKRISELIDKLVEDGEIVISRPEKTEENNLCEMEDGDLPF